ncbi:hypothetical protein F4818DRAFT_446052 [Hypoxylon cercidicola]|nr:hypothetical protein F4818DRAFT_446052 [Hypoxylon cercidicola]
MSFGIVTNFEVVLANGTVVNANDDENYDMLWALRGSSNNLGDVLAATAFQNPRDFKGIISRSRSDDIAIATATETYSDTLHIVLKNAILLMLILYRYLTGPFLPKDLARIGRAAASFKSILTKITTEEAAAATACNDLTPGGLLISLLRALKPQTFREDINSKTKTCGLLAGGILGNIFAVNFAGHDTVLITLHFALTLLAANTDIQEWLHEEIVESLAVTFEVSAIYFAGGKTRTRRQGR